MLANKTRLVHDIDPDEEWGMDFIGAMALVIGGTLIVGGTLGYVLGTWRVSKRPLDVSVYLVSKLAGK